MNAIKAYIETATRIAHAKLKECGVDDPKYKAMLEIIASLTQAVELLEQANNE